MNGNIVQAILYLTYVLQILIFVRIVLSWLPLGPNPVSEFVIRLTDLILSPLRRVLPKFGMFDLAPMIALLIIVVVQRVLQGAA
ncbi:MAG: YggT family protein [Dehalococcoidia bacterium]|nr:YggT family protein [Dehalococcoidia bacterium]